MPSGSLRLLLSAVGLCLLYIYQKTIGRSQQFEHVWPIWSHRTSGRVRWLSWNGSSDAWTPWVTSLSSRGGISRFWRKHSTNGGDGSRFDWFSVGFFNLWSWVGKIIQYLSLQGVCVFSLWPLFHEHFRTTIDSSWMFLTFRWWMHVGIGFLTCSYNLMVL